MVRNPDWDEPSTPENRAIVPTEPRATKMVPPGANANAFGSVPVAATNVTQLVPSNR